MNVPKKRPFIGSIGLATPEGGTYAKYKNDLESAKDYLLWLSYTKFPENVVTSKDFVDAMLTRGYFTASPDLYLKMINSYL